MSSLFGGGGGDGGAAMGGGDGGMGGVPSNMQSSPSMDMGKMGKGLSNFGGMTGLASDQPSRMMAPIGWMSAGQPQYSYQPQQMPSVTNPGMAVQSMADIVGRTSKYQPNRRLQPSQP